MKKIISSLLVAGILAVSAGAQVSVPAAFWLIGASLLGLVGFIARKPS